MLHQTPCKNLNQWRHNGGTSLLDAVSQRHFKLLSLPMRTTSLIYSLCPPALLDQPGAAESNIQTLKNKLPATTHQSHGAFDLHLQIYIMTLLAFAFYSPLLPSPSSLFAFSITPPPHPSFTCTSCLRFPGIPSTIRSKQRLSRVTQSLLPVLHLCPFAFWHSKPSTTGAACCFKTSIAKELSKDNTPG